MDLNRQSECIKKLIWSENMSDEVCRSFCLGEDSSIDVVQLWEGILIWVNDIRIKRLIYPMSTFDTDDYLLLNICHAGRCEVEMVPGNYVYMSPGILNVSASRPKSDYYYPGSIYSGIEFCFNTWILRDRMPDALTAYGFDYALLERYAAKENILAVMTASAMQEEERLFNMIRGKKDSLQAIRFAALSLVYHLINGECNRINNYMLISKGQRRIATEAEKLLTADLQMRYTIEELASRFGVSSSALKKYFLQVYGKSISQYMREKRMKKATELLADTDESIGEIALACGYEHQGKFGTAFRAFAGVSPMEYRRLNRNIQKYHEEDL